MKQIKQFAIVKSDSAPIFEQLLNERVAELPDTNPDVKISESGNGLTAIIVYMKQVEEKESEPKYAGVTFTCGDCPHFEPQRKKNGEIDERCKFGFCPFAEYGGTHKTARACNLLYQEIRNGGITVCLTKLESE